MTTTDKQDADAAEYVIGIMSPSDQIAFAGKLENEPALARSVLTWEQRFAPLNTEYQLASPPDRVKAAIDQRLFGTASTTEPQARRRPILPALIAASLAVLMVFVGVQLRPNQPEFVAHLDSVHAGYSFQASYDLEDQLLTVTLLEGQRPETADFEVWAIADDGVPLSLGVLPQSGQIAVQSDVSIAKGLTLAVSLEPVGGSPTGAPTGPVLSAGTLNDV